MRSVSSSVRFAEVFPFTSRARHYARAWSRRSKVTSWQPPHSQTPLWGRRRTCARGARIRQIGSVQRHGNGWRGYWREDGKRRATRTVRTKGEARRLLTAEIRRLELGDAYQAPITFNSLADRFLEQYVAADQTVANARRRLKRPRDAFGDAQAADVTPEAIQRVLAVGPGKAYRRDIVRTLRMNYSFGVENRLVSANPAKLVAAPKPLRGERILPLSLGEVDRVAQACGRWGPLVMFMADTGLGRLKLSRLSGAMWISNGRQSSSPASRSISRGGPCI